MLLAPRGRERPSVEVTSHTASVFKVDSTSPGVHSPVGLAQGAGAVSCAEPSMQ